MAIRVLDKKSANQGFLEKALAHWFNAKLLDVQKGLHTVVILRGARVEQTY